MPCIDKSINLKRQKRCDPDRKKKNGTLIAGIHTHAHIVYPREHASRGLANEIGDDIFSEESNMYSLSNRYKANNATLEPWHNNLAEIDTIEQFPTYVTGYAEKQVQHRHNF